MFLLFCGFAVCLCDSFSHPVASGGPLSLPPKKAAKETAKGNLFRGGSLWNPSPTTKGAPPPLDSRRGFYGGRGTKDESFLVKKVIGFGYGFESFGAGRTKSFELYGDLMSDNYEYSSVDHVEVYIQGYSWW
jgi:hypothetical protein